MSTSSADTGASSSRKTLYEVRLAGHLDQHWSAWFGGFAITHEDDGTTTLRGVVTDQSELHGLLTKVRDLGAALISVTPARPPTTPIPSNSNTADPRP
jgi:hypothetical protein